MTTALVIEEQATDVADRVACICDSLNAHSAEFACRDAHRLAMLVDQLTRQVERLAGIVATGGEDVSGDDRPVILTPATTSPAPPDPGFQQGGDTGWYLAMVGAAVAIALAVVVVLALGG